MRDVIIPTDATARFNTAVDAVVDAGRGTSGFILAHGQAGRGAVQQDARPVPAVQFQAMLAPGQTAAHGVHTAREDHVRAQTHLHLGPGLHIVGDGRSRDAQGQAPGIGGREKVAVYAVAFPVPVLMPGDDQGDGIGISGHKQAAPDWGR